MAGEWREVPLVQVAGISSGKRPSRALKDATSDCYVPIIGGGGPSGYTDSALFDGGVIITGRVGTLGKLFAPSGPCWPSDNALVIQPSSPETDFRFLRYALQHVIAEAAGMNRGAANPLITQGDLGRLPVSHPPLPEQRAIAHILGTLDDKIELNRRMSETLEQMARALFKAWFVDFEPVRAKMEGRWRRGESLPGLPAHLYDLFPDRLVDSELGEIPEGWEVKSVGDEVEIVRGVSYRSEDLLESDTALATLKSFNRGGGYRFDGLKPYIGSYKREQEIRPGELIVAQTDVTQSADVIGKPALVLPDNKYRVLVASLDVLIIRPRGRELPREFFYILFSTPQFQEHIHGYINGTTVLHLSKDGIPSFRFARPSDRVGRAFSEFVTPLFSRIMRNALESHTLAALRDTLLPKLISGQIRVRDAERFLEKRRS